MEEIISHIRNPDLDLSMDDIEAMVEGAQLTEEPKEAEAPRISPEFARAAGLLDKVGGIPLKDVFI